MGAAARRERRGRLPWLLAVVAVLSVAGCLEHPDAHHPRTIAERWITGDPSQIFEPSQLLPSETLQEWRFAAPGEIERWRLDHVAVQRVTPDAVVLRPVGPRPRLGRQVELTASDVDAVELVLAGRISGRVALEWAGPGQGFSDNRRISLPTSQGRGGDQRVFTFPVGLDPAWQGGITQLRLQPTTSAGDTPHLIALRATAWTAEPAVLDQITSRPWQVRLGDEVRSALVVRPGAVDERRVELAEGDELRLGFALSAAATVGAHFQVEAVTGDGRTVTLLDRMVRAVGAVAAWHDVTVPLDPVAPGTATLRLTVVPAGTPDPVRDLAMWSDPVILRPTATPATNVVMISLDTLRADQMSAYGHAVATTPRIAEWAAQDAVLFEHVVAPAPWTLPSHVSLFTGLDAPHHGVNHTSAVPAELELLAERLRAAGWRTAAVTGGGILRPRYAFNQGFDSFAYWSDESSSRELAVGLDRALHWLDQHADEPFFLFFHTYEIHYPHRRRQPWFDRLYPPSQYRFPASEIQMRPGEVEDLVFTGDTFVARRPGSREWQGPLTDDEKALVRAMYDSAVAYADDAVGHLLDQLEEHGLRDRTLVVLLSDHGEALGEDDRAGHSYLEDYNLMVPLILELAGGAGAGRRVTRQVSLVDVMPTVLDALGLEVPAGLDGRSLLPLAAGDAPAGPSTAVAYAASSNRGLALRVDDRLKYVLNNAAWRSLSGTQTLYDVAADPAERHDLAGGDDRTATLRTEAVELLDRTEVGIRVTIANAGPGTLTGQLLGAWHDHARVKTLEPGADYLAWDRGRAGFELPAGARTTIVVECPRSSDAGLEGTLAGPPPVAYRHDVDLAALGDGFSLVWTGSGWRRADAPLGAGDTGFEIRRTGPVPSDLKDSQLGTDGALEQLRALGYVE